MEKIAQLMVVGWCEYREAACTKVQNMYTGVVITQ